MERGNNRMLHQCRYPHCKFYVHKLFTARYLWLRATKGCTWMNSLANPSFPGWTARKNHYKSLNMDEYGQRICPSNKHHLWSSIHTWQRQETHLSMGCLSIRLNEYAVINDKVMMPIVSMRVLPNGILKHAIYTHLLVGYSYCALVVYYG